MSISHINAGGGGHIIYFVEIMSCIHTTTLETDEIQTYLTGVREK